MFSKKSIRRALARADRRFRRLGIERLEDRRMLTTMADIVFLVDESGSASGHDWLDSIVQPLDDSLRAGGVDVRYGLVGYGDGAHGNFAHSHDVDLASPISGTTVFDGLWSYGTTPADHVSDLRTAIGQLVSGGEGEDGWDAIDHVIAEYNFRDTAVPVFVLVQNGSGRVDLNTALTHAGILSELKSKNVIFDAIGTAEAVGVSTQRLFDLTGYTLSSDIEVLGVDADAIGNGAHTYHAFNTTAGAVPSTLPQTIADALQVSFDGSNTGATGMVGTGKSILIGKNISGGIGPSAAGYRAESVPFKMENMAGATTHNPAVAIPSFSFNFFGTPQGSVFVNSNGTITFGAAVTSGSNLDLSHNRAAPGDPDPRAILPPTIAALWDNLGSGGQIMRKLVDADGDGQQNDMAIQWNGFHYAGDTPAYDTITFQAVLYSDGRIRFNYQDLDSFPAFKTVNEQDTDTTVNITGGISATVGIWKGSPDAVTVPAGVFVPGLNTVGLGNNDPASTSSSGDNGEVADSYVRLAWDTGGSVWDYGVVDRHPLVPQGQPPGAAEALRAGVIASIRDQVNTAAGKVFRADDPANLVAAINYGSTSAVEGFSSDPGATQNSVTWADGIDTTSNSIPLILGTNTKMSAQVFKTGRRRFG